MWVLFVCDGNIFRSTMAEALFNRIVKEKIGSANKNVRACSAGIIAVEGNPPSRYAVEVLKNRNINLGSFRARQLTSYLIREADLILTMEEKQKHYVSEIVPEAAVKTYSLKEFCGRAGEIHDLGRGGLEEAEEIAQEIEDCIRLSLPKILGYLDSRRQSVC